MHSLALGRVPLMAVLLLACGGSAAAQQRTVISSEIAVSGGDASLLLAFSDDAALEIRFEDGAVFIDGEEVGTYGRGDPLERSWRGLLGEAVALDDGPLAEALMAWSPPEALEGEALALGQNIDAVLDSALQVEAEAQDQSDPDVSVSMDLDLALLGSLIGRTDRFVALAEALEDLDLDFDDLADDDIHVHLGEEVAIERGESLQASLILIDSDLDVQGHLEGNAILVGGSLRVGEDAEIDGQVHLAEARVFRDGGEVHGGINRIRLEREVVDSERFDELRSEIRDEIREELRTEIRNAVPSRREARDSRSMFGTLEHVGRGIGGMMGNLMTFAIIAVLAFGVVRFFGNNLEVVAETARQSPGRAGVVGVAGAFLLLPVWILGIVGLAISLIGIPVLLAWIPLFPVAAALGMGLGSLAVASNVGDWVSRQHLQGFDWVRRSSPLSVVLAGVAALILPFFAANFIHMAGSWLGFVRGILHFVGTIAVLVSMSVGFGAVLLTRGGRRRDWSFADADRDLDAEVWDDEFGSTGPSAEADAQSAEGTAPADNEGTDPSDSDA